MSQPVHENRDLRAAWLPSHEHCWSCDGTGKQQVFYDGCVFETDEPCDECGGTGRDYPEPTELPYDRYPETLQAMREERQS